MREAKARGCGSYDYVVNSIQACCGGAAQTRRRPANVKFGQEMPAYQSTDRQTDRRLTGWLYQYLSLAAARFLSFSTAPLLPSHAYSLALPPATALCCHRVRVESFDKPWTCKVARDSFHIKRSASSGDNPHTAPL